MSKLQKAKQVLSDAGLPVRGGDRSRGGQVVSVKVRWVDVQAAKDALSAAGLGDVKVLSVA